MAAEMAIGGGAVSGAEIIGEGGGALKPSESRSSDDAVFDEYRMTATDRPTLFKRG